MTKKVSKNVKVIEFIERIGELYFCTEPTDDDIIKIVSALGGYEYQTELVKNERRRHRRGYWDEEEESCVEQIYILNIYKKITKEVEE